MADNWEDAAEEPPASGGFKFNANASSFSFNPGAATFVPGGAPKPAAAAAPVPKPVVVAAEPTPETPKPAAPSPDLPKPVAKPTAEEKKKVAEKMTSMKLKQEPADDPEAIKAELAKLNELDKKEHVNIVFIGHVDAGKSTLGGQILFLTGNVDDRTIQKYEREAKEKNRDSWYMAYIMDTNEEERAKGKTVEVGRAHFETDKKRYTILDAPGHKNYVPNMIGGASQADIGVLVIAARKGEFETGFERGGQTREHAQLAKTVGLSKLVVAINKMDDPSICPDGGKGEWSKERFEEIALGLSPFLKQCGYNVKKDVYFVPLSALTGANIKEAVDKSTCPWWSKGSLFSTLDNLDPMERLADGPLRMPIQDRYRDMGTVLMGKLESGIVKQGQQLIIMPNKTPVTVTSIMREEDTIEMCGPGENLCIKVSGVEEDDVHSGFVLSSAVKPVPTMVKFEAQIAVLELMEHKAIFTAGYKAVLHMHSLVKECEVLQLLFEIDPRTKDKKRVKFVKSGKLVIARLSVETPICLETFASIPQLGRFTLRDEGRTIAIGKVTRLPKEATS